MMAVFIESKSPAKLISGDKRALRLISRIALDDRELVGKLDGYVDCMEGILLGMIDRFGFNAITVRSRVRRMVLSPWLLVGIEMPSMQGQHCNHSLMSCEVRLPS